MSCSFIDIPIRYIPLLTSYVSFSLLSFNLGGTISTTTATLFTTGMTTTTPPLSSKSGKVGLFTKSSKSSRTDLPTVGTDAVSTTRCNSNDYMVWYYDTNKGLCTNEEVDNMVPTEDNTDMIYESLGDCCDVHFNIRVSNDVGLDFDSNGVDNKCDSFDVCKVRCCMWYQPFDICLYLPSYHHHHHLIVYPLYINQIERQCYSIPNNHTY